MISRDTYIELTKFGIVGGICFGLDLAIYYGLTEMFGVPTFAAKAIGVIAATSLNYYLNKSWTWGRKDRSNKRFAKYMLLYCVSGAVNVLSNELFFHTLPQNEFQMFIADTNHNIQKPFFTLKLHKFLAVILATVIGMIINFIGQKIWVFREGVNGADEPGEEIADN